MYLLGPVVFVVNYAFFQIRNRNWRRLGLCSRHLQQCSLCLTIKKVPNLGPGHCLDTKGFACISFSCLHFLIKFVLLSSEVPGKALRDALKEGVLPLDRILLESNAPYMTPNASDKELDDVCKSLLKRCKRGRNEPCTLPIVAHIVAKCLGVDAEEVARASAENTRRVFDLMASQSASQDNKDLNK